MRVPSMFILSAALLSINCDQCEPMERAIATSPDDAFSAVERLYDCGGAPSRRALQSRSGRHPRQSRPIQRQMCWAFVVTFR